MDIDGAAAPHPHPFLHPLKDVFQEDLCKMLPFMPLKFSQKRFVSPDALFGKMISLKAVFNKFNQFEQYKHDCIQSLFALGNKSDINLKVDIDENENEIIENEI